MEKGDFRFYVSPGRDPYESVADGAATEMDRYDQFSYAASDRNEIPRQGVESHLRNADDHRNCTNNYGPEQFPENSPLDNCPRPCAGAPLYGDGMQQRIPSISDHCHALDLVLSRGKVGETYNVASGKTRGNRDVVEQVAILDRKRPWRRSRAYQALINVVTGPATTTADTHWTRKKIKKRTAVWIPTFRRLSDTVQMVFAERTMGQIGRREMEAERGWAKRRERG